MTIGKGSAQNLKSLPRQIIGVVADVRDTELNNNPEPVMYIPEVQISRRSYDAQ